MQSRADLIRLFVTGLADGTGAAGAGSSGGGANADAASADAGDSGDAGEGNVDSGDAGDKGAGAAKPPKPGLTEDDKLKQQNQDLRTHKKVLTKVTGFQTIKEAEDYYRQKLGGKTVKQFIDEHAKTASTGQGDGADGEGRVASAGEELLRRQNEEKDAEIQRLRQEGIERDRKNVEDTAKGRLRSIAAEVGVKAHRIDVATRLLADDLVRDDEGNLEKDADGNFLIWRTDSRTGKRIPDTLSVDSLRLIVDTQLKEFVETRGSGGSGGSQRGEGRGGAASDPSKGLYTIDDNGNVRINTGEYNKLDDGAKRKLQEDIARRATTAQ